MGWSSPPVDKVGTLLSPVEVSQRSGGFSPGSSVRIVAQDESAGWSLITLLDDDGNVGVVPTQSITHVKDASMALSAYHQPGVAKPAASPDAGDAAGSVDTKVDRSMRGWRNSLRSSLVSSDAGSTERLMNQLSQMNEWKRAKDIALDAPADFAAGPSTSNPPSSSSSTSSSRIVSTVTESMLQLLEATSTIHSNTSGSQPPGTAAARSVTAPRNDRDEFAWEGNTPLLELLRLHAESAARLSKAVAVPAHASSALALAVTQGLHGGPGISNERASDVSGLAAVAKGKDAAGTGSATSSIEHSLMIRKKQFSSSSRRPSPVSNPFTVQLLVEVDVARCLRDFGQPGDLYVSVYDSISLSFVTDEARVFVDASGQPSPLPRPANDAASTDDSRYNGSISVVSRCNVPAAGSAQALFLSVPRALLASGKAYLVFRLYRLGPLKESAAAQAMSGTPISGGGGGATATPTNPGKGGSSGQAFIADTKPRKPTQTASEAAAGLDSDSEDDDAVGDVGGGGTGSGLSPAAALVTPNARRAAGAHEADSEEEEGADAFLLKKGGKGASSSSPVGAASSGAASSLSKTATAAAKEALSSGL